MTRSTREERKKKSRESKEKEEELPSLVEEGIFGKRKVFR